MDELSGLSPYWISMSSSNFYIKTIRISRRHKFQINRLR